MGYGDSTRDAIIRIFQDPTAAWTLDELGRRFELSIGEAVRMMSDSKPSVSFVARPVPLPGRLIAGPT